MGDLITGILIDLSLIGGVILFLVSFFKKYKEYRLKMLIVSLILIAVGIIFIDISAISEAYQSGLEFGSNK